MITQKIEGNRSIIGLTGFAQSGKDSVGKILIDSFGFKRLSFADALRESLYALNPIVETWIGYNTFWDRVRDRNAHIKNVRVQDIVNYRGWDSAKVRYPEIRTLLQRLGTEAGREIHGQNCWTNIIKDLIDFDILSDYVITDVRFPNELELVHSLGGKVFRVERDGVKAVNSHISDKPLEGVDDTIHNSGTLEDLEKELIQVLLRNE